MTTTRRTPLLVVGMAGLAVAVASVGTAVAVSGGGYTPSKQGCRKGADATNRANGHQSKGCHDTQLLVRDSKGHTYVEVGTNTTKQGNNPHSGNVMVSPGGSGNSKGHAKGTAVSSRFDTNYQPIPPGQCGVFDMLTYPFDVATGSPCTFDPTKWRKPKQAPSVTPKVSIAKKVAVAPKASNVTVYFGADDGLDSGEHDEPDGKHGTKNEQNGPSDGGAIVLRAHPTAVSSWLPLVMAGVEKGKPSYVAQNPLPVVDAGTGACADGICTSTQTRKRQVYHGGGGGGNNRDVYNYDGKTWDPYNCSSGSPKSEQQCRSKNGKNEDSYRRKEARHVNAQPGIQIYEDPDPNGSPIAPSYPLPAGYVGTCGVTVGGGPLKAPASPVTNHSGQVSVSPTHC